ncbi:MFS general substrate transporter [Clavulina sp. PMI_390]|nr:MFS general substrate transporter [Clavulina sp. PMI_390]
MYGRRNMLLIATLWTGAWGLGCGFAPDEVSVDVMRALQGLGPAGAIPACMGILAQSFPEGTSIRTIAFATFSSGAPIGAALANVLSGFLTEYTHPGWRYALWAQAGLSFLTTLMTLVFIFPDSQTHLAGKPFSARRGLWKTIDWFGIALITSGLILLVFSIGYGESATPHQWKTPYIPVLLILSAILIIAFVFWEAHLGGWPSQDMDESFSTGLQPLLKLSIFKRGEWALSAMLGIALFVWAGFTGWIFFAVLYYQSYLGLAPVPQMLRLLPTTGAGLFANISVAILVGRVHGLFLVMAGCILTSLAPLLFAVIDVDETFWTYGFFSAILCVFGSDYIFVSGTLLMAKVSRPEEQSLSGGLFIIVTQIGTSIGLSLCSIVMDHLAARKARELGSVVGSGAQAINNAPREALLAGYRGAQWVNFGYCMMGLILAVLFLRHVGIVAPEGPPGKSEDGEKTTA